MKTKAATFIHVYVGPAIGHPGFQVFEKRSGKVLSIGNPLGSMGAAVRVARNRVKACTESLFVYDETKA